MSEGEPMEKKAKIEDGIAEDADMDSAIIELEMCHNELDKLNEKENEEVIAMDQKYRKLRQKCYDKRGTIIEKIPDFWFTVFTGHPDLCNIFTEEEENCLHYLHNLEIDMAENNSGYSLKFHFKENPLFKNNLLVKEISYKQDKMTSESTDIAWIKPQKKPTKGGKKKKEDAEPQSFFAWFSDNSDPSNDKIAEIIKDDVWANTLQYYLPDPDMEEDEDDSSDGEGLEEENGDKPPKATKAKGKIATSN